MGDGDQLMAERRSEPMRYPLIPIVVALFANAQSCFASPTGLWQASDGAVIRIKPCGRNLCGYVVSTYPLGRNPETGEDDYSDKRNDDVTKRDRSRIGIEVLISMRPDGPSKWSGQLYSDRNGQTYSGDLIELNPSTLRVQGCWLVFCAGEKLTRSR